MPHLRAARALFPEQTKRDALTERRLVRLISSRSAMGAFYKRELLAVVWGCDRIQMHSVESTSPESTPSTRDFLPPYFIAEQPSRDFPLALCVQFSPFHFSSLKSRFLLPGLS